MCDESLRVCEAALERAETFLRRFQPLTNAHNNDFITDDLWSLLPPPIAAQLETVDDWRDLPRLCVQIRRSPSSALCHGPVPSDLAEFLANAMSCTLEATGVLSSAPTLAKSSTRVPESVEALAMGEKKWHEVEKLSAFTAAECHRLGINKVVDVGSGKGYLGTHLTLSAGLTVLEVDAEESNTKGATARRTKLRKRWEKAEKRDLEGEEDEGVNGMTERGEVLSLTDRIDTATHLDALVSQNLKGPSALTGLHTCGYLAMCLINAFLESRNTKLLVNVGCCYHLLDEKGVEETYAKHRSIATAPSFPMSSHVRAAGITLGRNSRMVATQSVERLVNEDLHPHIFYRVLLQQILKEQLGYCSANWIVGKLTRKRRNIDFLQYVRKALTKLKMEEISQKLSDEDIKAYANRWAHIRRRFHLFYVLRCCLGCVIESYVLLDRLSFLLEEAVEKKVVSKVELVKIFDPSKSPRCYAIVAEKADTLI